MEVLEGATLTIPAGVKVEFQDFYFLDIKGSIQAMGEAQNYIRFTSSQPDLFAVDYSTDGAWNGVKFHNTSYQDEPSILKCCIIEYSKNIETNGIGATVSCFDFSNLRIENCFFQNNVADYGTISLEFNSNPQIINNIFTENYTFITGAPIYCTYSYPKIISNTIVANEVLNDDVFFNKGVIHTFQAKPLVMNNIIWDNSGYFLEDNPLLFCKYFYTEFNDINFDHAGAGNLNSNPLFDPVYPFSLTSNSPCIDAGTNEIPFDIQLPEFDFLGNERLAGNQIDMGALEWQNTGYSNNQLPMTNDQLTNYPNPFNPSTTISFNVTQTSPFATIEIYNLKGQKVKNLTVSPSQSLNVSVVWDGTDQNGNPVSSGIYLAKVKLANQTLTRKMMLIK
ncbi:MAG: T9SS type A sorting domain-containing protein [Candidatus Cloacimonetes bacterium]|nr:T9SS type A sorting domain-containing protein [Candidatus Cloacimonadota bacterium]MCF7815317.1 T9SS type A sorting domain-containing protein [Candidatus Cloacimonadota bacterium]MCF7869431.1 T9SS type A sorting domain-containing protein [Candidatus Cloacimonadota bacterium]MCF7884822.1 T9SS type A sorting domain-containing protein [Candidatus Cloacimonadota bacterium]